MKGGHVLKALNEGMNYVFLILWELIKAFPEIFVPIILFSIVGLLVKTKAHRKILYVFENVWDFISNFL